MGGLVVVAMTWWEGRWEETLCPLTFAGCERRCSAHEAKRRLPLSAYAENKMADFTSGQRKPPRRLFF